MTPPTIAPVLDVLWCVPEDEFATTVGPAAMVDVTCTMLVKVCPLEVAISVDWETVRDGVVSTLEEG